jgi:hypothetical protein
MTTPEKIAIVFAVVLLAYAAGYIHASTRAYRRVYRGSHQDAQMTMAYKRAIPKETTVRANQPARRHRAVVPTQVIPTYAPGAADVGHRVR